MADLTAAGFGDQIAERIRAEHVAISARWLERLQGLLSVEANEVFPTDKLLDHIPALIQELAGYIRAPEAEAVVANTFITARPRSSEAPTYPGGIRPPAPRRIPLARRHPDHFVQEELQRMASSPGARSGRGLPPAERSGLAPDADHRKHVRGRYTSTI